MNPLENLKMIFHSKQHETTTRWRDGTHYANKKFLFNNKNLKKIIETQPNGTDVYITKYPQDRMVSTIILDFDSNEDIKLAYRDVNRAYNYLKSKNLNSVIVESGNKGYHLYIQTQPMCFKLDDSKINFNLLFNLYVDKILGDGKIELSTLDEVNSKAGLNGNIRLLYSIHPISGKQCKPVKGTFLNLNDEKVLHEYMLKSGQYPYDCYEDAEIQYKILEEQEERIKQESLKKAEKYKLKGFGDPIKENDLRLEIPRIYGGTVKDHGEYIMVNCFEHNDSNPSMVVTKEYYYCKSCGAKGNIWSLIKKGDIKLQRDIVKSKKVSELNGDKK
jgi:hypothetical protein